MKTKDKPWLVINETPRIEAQQHQDGVMLHAADKDIHFVPGMEIMITPRQEIDAEGNVEEWAEFDLTFKKQGAPGQMTITTWLKSQGDGDKK